MVWRRRVVPEYARRYTHFCLAYHLCRNPPSILLLLSLRIAYVIIVGPLVQAFHSPSDSWISHRMLSVANTLHVHSVALYVTSPSA